MARLFEQLKRRNVLRAVAGYAVVAWLIIEVADTVFPILGIPDWVTTMVVVLIIIGFPVTLVVSWIYQWTPAGIMTEKEADAAGYTGQIGLGRQIDFVIIILLVIAIGWLIYDRAIEAPVPENSIAVMPFVNMSDDPDNEYFADGISEEILNLLAKIPDLKVIARTSSFAFKGKNEDVRNIGEALGVKTILEGSVRKSGDQVRITTQLINVLDGTHIWSDNFDRTMTDIFAVQNNVAAAIIDALEIHIGVKPTRGRPTESPEAYTHFLKARVLLDAQQGREAIELLLQAIELDSNFAEAVELLAFAYWQQGGTSIDIAEAQKLSNETAAKAIAINPDLTFARALYQNSSVDILSVSSAIDLLEQAWREQPSNSAPLRVLIYELTYRGYLSKAHRFAVQFVERDPLSPVANYNLGESFVALGRTDEATPPLKLSLELDNAFANWFAPAFDLLAGRDENAIAHYEVELERAGIADSSWVRELIIAARDPLTGESYLDSRIPQVIESIPEELAIDWQFTFDLWYLIFGHLDHYYEEIFAAGPDDETWSDADVQVWQGTIFRRVGFTSHPKYLEAAEMLGMFDIWEHRGPPDFCEKVGGKWVCE